MSVSCSLRLKAHVTSALGSQTTHARSTSGDDGREQFTINLPAQSHSVIGVDADRTVYLPHWCVGTPTSSVLGRTAT